MLYKVTGLIRNGRWDNVKEEWELARITPRFFPRYLEAKTYFGSEILLGTIWRKNEEGSRNSYSVIETVGIEWPSGARIIHDKLSDYKLIEEIVEANPP